MSSATDQPQESILSSSGASGASAPDNYDPLGTCPTDLKSRYSRLGEAAKKGHFTPILRLKCLECCAWQPGEVAKCHINECALYARNKKARERGK